MHIKLASCNKFVRILQHLVATSRYQYAFAWLAAQLVSDKSFANRQQVGCKLVVKTCYPQTCCKLFPQVVTSLRMTNYDKAVKFAQVCRVLSGYRMCPKEIRKTKGRTWVFAIVAFGYLHFLV